MAKIIGNTTATPYPRPDWNQNDETKADYIKNRTHYTERKSIISSYYCSDDGMGHIDLTTLPEIGKIYKYEIDGVVGEVVFSNFDESITLGTLDCGVYEANTNGIDHLYLVLPYDEINIDIYEEKIVPIDEKYIPDSIARASDVEKMLEDNGGINADWNQNDKTASDYIKNRPCYIDYQGEKTFDDYAGFPWIEFTPSTLIRKGERHAGNIDWLISGNAYGLKLTGYLGNDTVFTYENTITATSSVLGVVLSTEEEGTWESYENSMAWADSPVHFIIEEEPFQRVDNYTFSVADDIEYDRVEIGIKGTFYRERIKTIDEKYLPVSALNKNWDEILDKPELEAYNNENHSIYFGNSLLNPEEGFAEGENAFGAGYGCVPATANSQAFGYYTSIGIKGYKVSDFSYGTRVDSNPTVYVCNFTVNTPVDNDTNTGASTQLQEGVKVYALAQLDAWNIIEVGNVSEINGSFVQIEFSEQPELYDYTDIVVPMIFLETPKKTELLPGTYDANGKSWSNLGDVMTQGPDVMALTSEQVSDLQAQGIKIQNAVRGHAEGHFSYVGGNYGHAQNNRARAIGESSDAGGQETWARGNASMTRGVYTQTMPAAQYAFARGRYTVCHKRCTEASGMYNEAFAEGATVRGLYATLDIEEKYLDMVGNGKNVDKRSNAYTLSKNGIMWVPTAFKVGGTSQDDKAAATVATLKDLENISIPENVVTTKDLEAYSLKSDLNGYALKTDLAAYALQTELTDYALKSDLDTMMLEIIETQKQIVGGEL